MGAHLHARASWAPEYSFDLAYGLRGFNPVALRRLQSRLQANVAMRMAYARNYTSGSGIGGITPSSFQAYWCGHIAMTVSAFATCISPVRGKRLIAWSQANRSSRVKAH